MKTLVIYNSIFYGNTEKIAKVIAKDLEANLIKPQQVEPKNLDKYDLIGFGSGIYYNTHHQSLLDIVKKIPIVSNKKAFIFSTNRNGSTDNHKILKELLEMKGFTIIGEFSCKGFEEWRAIKNVGGKGINEGKPDKEDLQEASNFAMVLKQKYAMNQKQLMTTN